MSKPHGQPTPSTLSLGNRWTVKDLNGTFIKIFSPSLETNYGDYTKDCLYTILTKIDAFETLHPTNANEKEIIIQKTTNAISLTCLITTKQNISLKRNGCSWNRMYLEDWLIETNLASKTHQINYYKSLQHWPRTPNLCNSHWTTIRPRPIMLISWRNHKTIWPRLPQHFSLKPLNLN